MGVSCSFMKYVEAAALREEILLKCKLSASSVKIIPLKAKNKPPLFKLHLINVNFESMLKLQLIAEKHRLAVKDKHGVCIILNPASDVNVNIDKAAN